MDPTVTPPMQELIRKIKDALASAVTEYMRCESASSVDAKKIEAGLASLLGANKPEPAQQNVTGDEPEIVDQVYGAYLQIRVTRPDSIPRMIAVKASFGVDCGMDAMLLIFQRQDGNWRQTLRWQSGNYDEVSGAFGDFFKYTVLPGEAPAGWLVVVAHGSPWCTSRWSAFDLDVIEPAEDSSHPQVIFHKETGYVRDKDPVMKARPNGFEIRVEQGSIDVEIMTRPGIYRYRVDGTTVQRVQPVAMNGRDFVDEWLLTDWSDAGHWIAAANAKSLQEEHARFDALRNPKLRPWPDITYGAVRSCSDSLTHFQVEANQDPDIHTYYQISQGENSFTMLSASPTPDPRCRGADLMQKN